MAVILLALALLLAPAIARGATLLVVLVLILAAIVTLIGSRIWRGGVSVVPWIVSLAISAVLIAPDYAFAQHKHGLAVVVDGVFWWLVLAAFMRLVVFLSDYFRRRQFELPLDTRADT